MSIIFTTNGGFQNCNQLQLDQRKTIIGTVSDARANASKCRSVFLNGPQSINCGVYFEVEM